MEEEIVSEKTNKPIRDEETLAKVLEAAYVMQEHNRELRERKDLEPKRDHPEKEERAAAAPPHGPLQTQQPEATPKADEAYTLAQIVETQQQIRARHLPLENAISLIGERVTQIARASGAAIGILDGNKVHYRAAAGLMTLPAGTEVPVENALSMACLRSGKVFRCGDVNPELLLDTKECLRRGIQSLIAVPIFHNGGVTGALELYYSNTHAFAESDVHTCQLMAGLVTEALARNEEVTWKKSLATERTVMLKALEKLKPNLAAIIDTPATKDPAARTAGPAMDDSSSTFVCRKCGHELVGQEQFCGNCGSPRSSNYEPPSMQSKVAALWHMQEAMNQTPHPHPADGAADGPVMHEEAQTNFDQVHDEEPIADSREEQIPDLFAAADPLRDETTESTELREAPGSADFENAERADLEIPLHTIPAEDVEAPEPTALAKPERAPAWSSAATTLDFLERLTLAKDPGAWVQFWNSRRGDIYLAIAVVLVLGVIRWAIWSNHSVSATGSPTVSAAHRRAAPDADLSLFDRILVELGLAEAPEPPVYKGNPRTQVWVDLNTALYYCPGADLYGKTPKGRFSSQRDAQLDQFEPAYRKACD